MAQTHLVNTNAETVDTNWTKVELSLDALSPLAAGPYLDHIEIVGTPAGLGTLSWQLTYDTAGIDPVNTQETTIIAATPPGGGVVGFSRSPDVYLAWGRTGRTPGTLFLWLKASAGTLALNGTAATKGVTVVLRDSRSER